MRKHAVVVFGLALVAVAGCRRDTRTDEEKTIDRAYDADQELAQAILDAPSCAAAVDTAEAVWKRRADDFAAARRMQDDPEALGRAVGALDSREERYKEVAALLDAATSRCENEPGLADIFDALDE